MPEISGNPGKVSPETIASDRLWRLSQRHLDLLSTCPGKFQQTFLDQLTPPPSQEKQESLAAGSRFHLLMQQRELGLPIEPILEADPQLRQWLDNSIAMAPEILTPNPLNGDGTFRQAEHDRTLNVQEFLLVVRYDLLIADDGNGQILDWKTYPRPQNQRRLAQNWQTRLYRYVLAETSQYEPEQISMTYWFVQSAGSQATVPEPQYYRFPYSHSQHQQTQKDLTRLLTQLRNWLQDYQQGKPFPTTQELLGSCQFCQQGNCQQGDGDSFLEEIPSLADIPEIPI